MRCYFTMPLLVIKKGEKFQGGKGARSSSGLRLVEHRMVLRIDVLVRAMHEFCVCLFFPLCIGLFRFGCPLLQKLGANISKPSVVHAYC